MEEKIHIYSDESNHDKSITNKENNINIDNEGLSREYVRSFLMINTSCLDDAENELNNLEKRYFSCQEDEPKGKVIFQLTKKIGLKNLSGDATKFLLDLLDFIEEFEIQIFLVVFNKFEYIINDSIEVDIDRFRKNINRLMMIEKLGILFRNISKIITMKDYVVLSLPEKILIQIIR